MGTKSTTVLTLNNPPLVEVACGVYFKNLDKLLIPHIGLLWEDFCGEFHRFEEYLPIQNLNNSQSTNPFIISSKPALPRIWFINENETSVLQIQRDLFMLNWRKTGNSDYPRFGKVYSDFKKYLETFKQFLVKNKLGSLEPVRFELGYINHIAQNQLWSKLNDLSQIFTVFNLINSTKLDESEAIGFDCLLKNSIRAVSCRCLCRLGPGHTSPRVTSGGH